MKTKHDYRVGDVIEHNGRRAIVEERNGNDVVILWYDGQRQEGKHYAMWMFTKIEEE